MGRRHSKGAAGLRMEQEKQAALAVENEEKRRVAEAAAVEAAVEAEKWAAVKAKQKQRKEANQLFTLKEVQSKHPSEKVRKKWLDRTFLSVTYQQWMTKKEALMFAPCRIGCSCNEAGACPTCHDDDCYIWCKGCYSWQHFCCSTSTLPAQAGMHMQKPVWVEALKQTICPMPECQKPIMQCECYEYCCECRLAT